MDLAFPCSPLGSLPSTLAVLRTQQGYRFVSGDSLARGRPEPQTPVPHGQLGCNLQPPSLQVSRHLHPAQLILPKSIREGQ
jgi:hypothetical protein